MASFKLRHSCFIVLVFCISISRCRGQGGGGGGSGGGGGGGGGTQDAIQIVAQAALCFDNRPVMNGCLQAMGINVGNATTTPTAQTSGNAPAPAPGPSAAAAVGSMCSGPCFGQMMLMMNCVNGILGNIQGYSPGLMQGVQAIFQMACNNGGGGGGGGNGQSGGGGGGGNGQSGGGGGGTNGGNSQGDGGTNGTPNGGSHMIIDNSDPMTSNGDGPTIRLKNIYSAMLIFLTCIWLLLF